MIKLILKGALGNQLFQYAHAKSLALKHNVPLVLDLSFLKARVPLKNLSPYKYTTYRDYDLNLFELEDETQTFYNTDFLDKYFAYPTLDLVNKFTNKNYIKEGPNPYAYDESIAKKGSAITLNGFWNNPRYFEKYHKELLEILDMDKLFDSEYLEFEKELENRQNSVGIHLRRGDYANAKNKNIYLLLDKYYIRATAYMKEKLENPYFYIFSQDDPTWIKQFLNLRQDKYSIVDSKLSGYKNRSHFRFLSLCKHNIIANSSYSWWAAFLNKNQNKIITAPTRWHVKYNFENIKSWVTFDP